MFYPLIALLRMAGIVFSLAKRIVFGIFSGSYFLEALRFVISPIYQFLCWLMWLFHSGVRMWFEYLWGFIAKLLLPFIWPIFFLIQLIFGVHYSSSKLSEKRNSYQSSTCRRRQKLHNYNFTVTGT